MQQALQAYGQPSWSLSLLSINAVDPSQPLAVELVCATKFGSICLDGSGLSEGAVKAIIAVGVIVIVFAVSSACVLVDILRRSGRVGPPPAVSTAPDERVQLDPGDVTAAASPVIGLNPSSWGEVDPPF